MKHNKIIPILTLSLCLPLLTGCSANIGRDIPFLETKEEEPKEIYDGKKLFTEETSELGIDSTAEDFEEQLVSGSYYVVHNGIYYPLYYHDANFNTSGNISNYADPSKQLYFNVDTEKNVPTLFLQNGDSLVYYDTENIVDAIHWDRYYDLFYTIGIYNLKNTSGDRYYIDLEEDNGVFVTDAGLSELYNELVTDQVLIGSIGNAKVDSNIVNHNLIDGLKKNKEYDIELYTGTVYNHYNVTCNTHALRLMEQFISVDYNTLQDSFYEIEIPDYLPTGYYALKTQTISGGVVETGEAFRLVKEEGYNDSTDYNKQLLYTEASDDPNKTEEELALEQTQDPDYQKKKEKNLSLSGDIMPGTYSEVEELNHYKAIFPGTLGYVDENSTTEEKIEHNKIVLQEAIIRKIDVALSKEKVCKIEIKSKKNESTGDIYIIKDKKKIPLEYDKIGQIYSVELDGDGSDVTLVISGLWHDYDINLTNCKTK